MLLVIHKADGIFFFAKILSRITELTTQKVLKHCYPNIILSLWKELEGISELVLISMKSLLIMSIDLKLRTAQT